MERRLLSEPLDGELLLEAKRMGFSDEMVGQLADRLAEQVRELRLQLGMRPVYKMVDTCAAEFDAFTPYFYSTYEEENEATPQPGKSTVVLGSGPIRIGQGIEFDYASVHAAWALQDAGRRAILVNSNPETVSTDFDTSDRLYFEPLDEESVRNILENEAGETGDAPTTIVQFGGQTAVNLAEPLWRAGQGIIGSSAETIDTAEDRELFERFLQNLGIPQPPGAAVRTLEEGLKTAQTIGYPVLVRPSYVLGGRAMEIVQNPREMVGFLAQAAEAAEGRPILIDKYLEGREVEVDAICDGERVLIPGIMEHIERAGVHSGDSMAVYPPVHLDAEERELICSYTEQIVLGMGAIGLTNIQYVVLPHDASGTRQVYVLEVNPRASRTVPFISKVTGVPMVQLAVRAMCGESLESQGYEGGVWPERNLVAVKAPVFSMSKLADVDTYLGPEMKSTGEVMGIDRAYEPAPGEGAAGLGPGAGAGHARPPLPQRPHEGGGAAARARSARSRLPALRHRGHGGDAGSPQYPGDGRDKGAERHAPERGGCDRGRDRARCAEHARRPPHGLAAGRLSHSAGGGGETHSLLHVNRHGAGRDRGDARHGHSRGGAAGRVRLTMIREQATVLSNEPCYEGGYILWLDAPALAAAGHTPGQFVMVHCAPEGGSPEFARAFSYHRAGEGRIALLYAVAGRGTGWLAGRRRGDAVSLYGPLGKGFRLPDGSGNLLLVAGGVGVAPMVDMAEVALAQGHQVTAMMGARHCLAALARRRLAERGRVRGSSRRTGRGG